MTYRRRDFLRHSSAAIGALAVPSGQVFAESREGTVGADCRPNSFPAADDPLIRELTAIALDAAKSAGATYADVRVTVTREHQLSHLGTRVADWQEKEHGAIGLRALVDGAWGFAASAHWTRDEAARLGREAAHIAKANAAANARGGHPRVVLDEPVEATSGAWKTPIQRDPFLVPWSERHDVVVAYAELAQRMFGLSGYGAGKVAYRRQEKTLATTSGSLQTQVLYWIEPEYVLRGGRDVQATSRFQPVAGGWEVYADPYVQIRDELPYLSEILAEKERAIPVMPDRYDVLFDGYAMAHLLGHIVGVATELDRILGWEANAGGTSYVAPVEELLGTRAFGSPLLNVSADRSRAGGNATVQWDDEGVTPREYPIVQEGRLVDCHTTREFAPRLGDWYRKQQQPIRSRACSASETAIGIPMLQAPNIAMHPGKDRTTFSDIEKGMTRGLVVCGGNVYTDRQKLNGEVNGHLVYEVKNGKRVSMIVGSEVLFRAPEILKNIIAIGGAGSQVHSGLTVRKGQPQQAHRFGVSAVPALIKNVAVTDIMRKS